MSWNLPAIYPSFIPETYLLRSTVMDTIQKYMSPDMLLKGAGILGIGIALMVVAIYAYLFNQKRNFFYTQRIQKYIEEWITQVIMEEDVDTPTLIRNFKRIMINKHVRQFAINELISCKKNFSGGVTDNIVSLYIALGFKEDSLAKLRNTTRWHIKARGIQELYLMEQQDILKTIYKNTNSTNEFVRMEAQTGVIHLTGFPGLRFLDVISYPLTEWQQLKLLEQLRLYPKKEDLSNKIPAWLRSSNSTVVVFALKLADEYQVFAVRQEVIHCLVHPDDMVRTQALKTLIRLADEETPKILMGYFAKESLVNRFYILDAMRSIGTEEDRYFIERLLDDENDTIKLKAAIVLVSISGTGMAVIEKRSLLQPEPFERIYRHIKTAS